jgi:ubiquitin-like-conjugating enzyme ATG10
MYFVLRQADRLLGIEEVYHYLVPRQYRKNIQSVGIMGGISFGVRAINFKLTLKRVTHIS